MSEYDYNIENNEAVEQERGPWKVFAKVSKILGIVSLSTCWICIVGCSIGVYGIIFGVLGKKSASNKALAKKGLKLSIIGTIVGYVLTLIFFFIVAFAEAVLLEEIIQAII